MAIMDTINDVARAISKDGFGEALRFSPEAVGKSASYNKVASAANDIIKTMGADEAQAVRKIIKEGGDFNNGAFADAFKKMSGGDESQKKIAEAFNDLYGKYENAVSENTVSAYAEFLGKDNGALGVMNTGKGYFFDKQNGKTRRVAAAGAAASVGVASRILSGGSLTRTNTGERDIAGIPFI